jgi:hypothetical protein
MNEKVHQRGSIICDDYYDFVFFKSKIHGKVQTNNSLAIKAMQKKELKLEKNGGGVGFKPLAEKMRGFCLKNCDSRLNIFTWFHIDGIMYIQLEPKSLQFKRFCFLLKLLLKR